MNKKSETKPEVISSKNDSGDTIIFMTAYDFHKFNRKLPSLRRKCEKRDLFEKFHIFGISTQDMIVTAQNKIEYESNYDYITHSAQFNFDLSEEKYDENIQHELNKMMTNLALHHSSRVMLDTTRTDIKFCFNMDSFLVTIRSEILRVDSIAYIINGVLVVNYELIHYETGKPLSIDEIYGRTNNYNIIPVESTMYFGEQNFTDDNRKISDIIFFNIVGFLEYVMKNKYEMGSYSFVHNILVFSKNVKNVNEYFKLVLGADTVELEINNIATASSFKYYSKEYLGLVTDFSEEEFSHILSDVQILESFKIYLLLQMILDVEINDKLDAIINHQIYLQALHYQSHAPIITSNLIESIKSTVAYNQYKSALENKIQALKIMQDRERNKNSKLLNILLYVLALLGSFQTLQVLQTELGLSFKYGMIGVCIVFGVFGVIWICREK